MAHGFAHDVGPGGEVRLEAEAARVFLARLQELRERRVVYDGEALVIAFAS